MNLCGRKPFVPFLLSAYFLPLMNRLRTNTIRLIATVAICVGFGLYMVQQAQADHSSQAFANWLNSMVSTADGITVQQELDDLQKSTTHLDKIIKEASRIVKSNNENFDFPFSESTAPIHIYQLLLIEWGQFQTGSAMAGIPMPSVAKAVVSVVLENNKAPVGFAEKIAKGLELFGSIDALILDVDQLFIQALQPMTEGIAIGAP